MSRHLGRLLPTVILLALFGMIVISSSTVLRNTIVVNDAWSDSTRTDPASPTYSEYGTDSDGDGNIESAWYVNSPNVTVAPGHMNLTLPTGSQNWTTYFTPAASPITLASAGDFVQVIWVFTPSGVAATNTSQAFNFCLVDTPSAARLTGHADSAG